MACNRPPGSFSTGDLVDTALIVRAKESEGKEGLG